MESRTYYYARVSSKEQNLDRQLAAFKALGANDRDIITDKESGNNGDGHKGLFAEMEMKKIFKTFFKNFPSGNKSYDKADENCEGF